MATWCLFIEDVCKEVQNWQGSELAVLCLSLLSSEHTKINIDVKVKTLFSKQPCQINQLG